VDLQANDELDAELKMPRIVWFLWFQGIRNAPYVVQRCYESWVRRNPDWRVIALDGSSLGRFASKGYMTENIRSLPRNQVADLLRLDLLNAYGGVWADATCFSVRPLSEWLPAVMPSGFFAFERPGFDRAISSWFFAAEARNALVSRLLEFMNHYWGDIPVRRNSDHYLTKFLSHSLKFSPYTRGLWFSRTLRFRLGASPYFALHYAFEKLIREDEKCARIWDATPKVSAAGPHRLHAAGLLSPATRELREEIDCRRTPVYKTTWKLKEPTPPTGSVLSYLLDGT
jgi:Capsular polysaccharide synthesis protein